MWTKSCLCLFTILTLVNGIYIDNFDLASKLRRKLEGDVYIRGSPEYEDARPVHNGACRNLFPRIIARPLTSEDVSVLVETAVGHGLEISVRSGGHSFQCQGIKHDSLHIDMRSMNKIKLVPYENKVRIGGGATFKQVLKVVDPNKYTLIHGQVKNVGVAGYLLGVGVNPIGTTQRYGYGADHVIEYKIVLADGSVALVNNDNTTIISRRQAPVYEVYQHTPETNLRFGLRGSGASFGIVTEFLVKIYKKPETLSCVVFTFLESKYDFENLQKAGEDGRYGISIIQPLIFRRPKAAKLLAWAMIKIPQVLKWKSGKTLEPVVISVVDLKSPTKKTNAGKAIAFMKSYGLEVAFDNVGIMEKVGMDSYDLAVDDQESVYLTNDELKAEGYHAMISANMNGLRSFRAVYNTFLKHPVFGIASKKTPSTTENAGCDFCLWIMYIAKPEVNDNVIADSKIGNIAIELDCSYNSKDPKKAVSCPVLVKKAKQMMLRRAQKIKEDPHQYVNTPSCDKNQLPFGQRYWADGYPRLLKIKKFWDPANVFHYCHSVGSTEQDCCVEPLFNSQPRLINSQLYSSRTLANQIIKSNRRKPRRWKIRRRKY